MKSRDNYIEEYIDYLFAEEKDNPIYAPDIFQSRADFKAGYDLAEELFKPKWNNIQNPPDNDKEVLIYVRDHRTPWWSRNHFGSYINEKWYLKGGIEPHYELVKWTEIIEDKEELKTQQEWKEIFNKVIMLNYDGFENFNSDEKITEWKYVCRLAHSTTSL